ncbi:MAG TPA: deoxyribodipyrimidine photo-lyase [Saprospiraceae bacterium]|nr:deoxyribodipyrimidine photo-lyase [Saprospiraceae bacterium]HPI07382.1 deoxyribodipyrimidine photo-lyase [Saprospiraceae bacterium]
MNTPVSVFWFRRDLRLHDNAGLYHALKGPHPVLPLFIFDRNILDDLKNPQDARVTFIQNTLESLKTELESRGCSLLVYDGKPEQVWQELLQKYKLAAVYTNHDFEPYAIDRDAAVQTLLAERDIPFNTYKDHVIFEKDEVLKSDQTPYTVFTPYSKRWLEKLSSRYTEEGAIDKISFYLSSYPVEKHEGNYLKINPLPMPSLADIGFQPTSIAFPPTSVARGLIRSYDKTRDFPAIDGTSRLGIHFRFGTISIREKARAARELNAIFLNELIWRDFYSQILAHFPHVVGHPFRPQYDKVPWRDAPGDFAQWCEGRTGYPIVDAGMRQLNETGYMHNRVRMITASFLTKHLLLDWRLGEAYFAEKLLDYDLASNNGGWQWAAGCGTDAAPYFRIFNPTEQMKKFDPEFKYIRRWVPEFGTPKYLKPMVEHVFARERCLATYKSALAG